MAGLDEVAARAGVSVTTASRALSGRGRVSVITRDRVASAARELGFVASASASSLASGRTRNVGVLASLIDRWYFATVISSITNTLAPHGYDVTLYNLTEDPAQREHLWNVALRRRRVDGLIALSIGLSADEAQRMLQIGLPTLGIGAAGTGVPALRVDDAAVARTATEHLISLGHRRIAHIGMVRPGDAHDIPTLRVQGFRDALADAGLSPIAPAGTDFVTADFTIDDGYRAARELLDSTDRPTAIFAASDELAFGAIFAARELGLDVPGDLSIVGVDGHEMSAFFGLTTVNQFPAQQGERAADGIRALIETGAPVPAGTTPSLPFELITRASTGQVPAEG